MSTNNEQRTTNKFIWILFAVIIVAVYFFGLSIPLVGPDEPRYSQVAREMFLRGDWVTPTLGGFDWFEKPALLYWLQIAAYNLFGVTEFAARTGSALFGLGTIFSLWTLGRQWSAASRQQSDENATNNERRTTNNFANWLALVAASSIGLIVFSRGASFDIILTFPVTASLVGFFVWELGDDRRRSRTTNDEPRTTNHEPRVSYYVPLIAFYFFTGVALIAKGLVGAVFPLAIAAFYYVLRRKFPSKTFLVSLVWGAVLSLGVAAFWYVPMYLANGWKFIDDFFIQHHFQRYTSNKYQHPQPFHFFFWVLPLMTIPWLPFFAAAVSKEVSGLWSMIRGKTTSQNQKPKTKNPQLATFAWAWLLVPLVFFSFSGSKLPGYILPALPAALILTAQYIYEFVQKSRARRIALLGVAFLTFAVVAVLAQFFVHDFARSETVKPLIETADANGYRTEKILNLHTISHSAEFYGAGRLVRQPDGRQRRFYGVSEIIEQMNRDRTDRVLVLIPLDFLDSLTASPQVQTQVLDDNGELAIVLVKKRGSVVGRAPEPVHES